MKRELVELLRTLISIPSVNPEDTDDPEITGEKRLAEFFAEVLSAKGFDVEWDNQVWGRPNVLASYGPKEAAHTLLLESHLDTVSVRGMTRPPFEAVVEKGRVYGRGACDTKGPMAAALQALEPGVLDGLAEAGARLVYVGAMGEEKGNIGADLLVRAGLVRADEALVLEPTELSLVHAHKGSLWFSITVQGQPAHGSSPELGVNAIEQMRRVQEVLDNEQERVDVQEPDELLGASTMNVGVIQGGSAVNIVPPSCTIEVDRRTCPADHHLVLDRLRRDLDAKVGEHEIEAYDLHVIKDAAPFIASADSRLAHRLLQSCELCGSSSRMEGSAWFSDAGPLSRACDDVVVFGPGSIRQAHTEDEYIELDQLEKGAAILKTFLESTAREMADG